MNAHHNTIYDREKWKQAKCPSIEEEMNKWWYVHTMKHYSAMKRKEVLIHAIIWMLAKSTNDISTNRKCPEQTKLERQEVD
jgi:hypothetical protein